MEERGTKDNPRHILSISGGKDSAALAIYMSQTRNIEELEYVFMDTEQELKETYDYLDKLESILGCNIIRLKPKHSFEHYLKLHGNFLPSVRQRWCTINMKIKPFEEFVGQDYIFSYIGIRADESRDGYISNQSNITPVYPFKEDGLIKADIYRLLEDSGLSLPEYYKWRSRSGCYFCFYQRKVEWLGLKENHPDLYEKAKAFEKVDENTGKTFNWTDKGGLDELTKNPGIIRENHKKKMDSKMNSKKNKRLIDVYDREDPIEGYDTFSEVMRDEEEGEGCLICTL
jgi:3'-phosphoadenosine 5'-phosphosulfate sulfotransferase (PAPS reductase)/FAD synthetase